MFDQQGLLIISYVCLLSGNVCNILILLEQQAVLLSARKLSVNKPIF